MKQYNLMQMYLEDLESLRNQKQTPLIDAEIKALEGLIQQLEYEIKETTNHA